MRWTRQRFARDGIAGRVGERPVSDQQRADERCCSVRRSRVVLTPRRWRQVRGVKSAQPGLDKNISVGDGGKTARSPGRARRKPLKPLRAGTSGDSGVLVYSCAFLPMQSAHEAAGATGTRRSPRPLRGREIHARLGRIALRGREVAFGIGLLKIEPAAKYERAIASAVVARERGCDLILRSLRSKRLEGWTQRRDSRPSFETRARGALLRMRSVFFTGSKAGDPVFRDVNDGIDRSQRTGYSAGTCHRARRRRDPAAEYDGLCEAAPVF